MTKAEITLSKIWKVINDNQETEMLLSSNEQTDIELILQEYADQQTKELTEEVERFEEYYSSTKIHIEKWLNIIEKQRKEIEELKEENDEWLKYYSKKEKQINKLKAEAKEKDERISILESLLYSAKQSTSDLDLYKEIEAELNN